MIVNSLKAHSLVRGAPVGRLDDNGRGVVEIYVRKDKQLFEFTYDRALPGEKLHLRVGQAKHDRFKSAKQEPGRYRLALEQRGAASPDEVPAVCEHFTKDKCGGCTFQHMSYEAQLREKHQLMADLIKQFGLLGAPLQQPVASPAAFGFHSRTEFKFFLREGVQMGLHPAGSPIPVAVRTCHLHPGASQRAFEATLAALRAEQGAVPFNERTGQGYLCNAVFRSAPVDDGHEVLLTLKTIPSAPPDALRRIAASVMARCPEVVGVTWSPEGGEPLSRALGSRSTGAVGQEVLAGRAHLMQDVLGLRLESKPEPFVRPNMLMSEQIYQHVAELCGEGEVIWDAFCGQGLMTLLCLKSTQCRRIVSLDRSAPALASLSRNLSLQGCAAQVDVVQADLGSPAELRLLWSRMVASLGGGGRPLPAADRLAGAAGSDDELSDEGSEEVGDATSLEGRFTRQGQPSAQSEVPSPLPRPDLLVADPGRNGLPKGFRRMLYDLRAPVVVLVGSGRPLLRDAVLLQRRGYEVDSLVPFDSYPHSARLEVVARLRWRGLPGED